MRIPRNLRDRRRAGDHARHLLPRAFRLAAVSALAAAALIVRADPCSIDLGSNLETIDGFGFASVFAPVLTDAQAATFFGTGDGQLGFSLLRVYISESGDFSTDAANTALAHAYGARVLGTAWTPPPAMKTNNNAVGGYLNTSEYGAYAAYLANAAAAIGVDYVSFQNEPDITVTYQSCYWTPAQMETFCRDFAPMIGKPIVMPEWYHFDDSYSDPTLNDPTAASHVAIIGGHIYGGGNTVHQDAIDHGKHVWMTEHFNNDQTIAAAIGDAREVSDCMHNRMNAYIWWRAYHPTLQADDLIQGSTPLKNGYAIGQFSKYVRPGKVECTTTYNPSTSVYVTAYHGNGLVVVAVNTGSTDVSQTFSLQHATGVASLAVTRTSATEDMASVSAATVSNNSWTYTLPAQSVTTFRQVVTPASVTTFAGLAGSNGSADGTGAAARFDGPADVAVDSAGNLYVADAGNDTIRKITPAGVVTTLAGQAGTSGDTDSPPRFNQPAGVAVDASGNVYVADTDNDTIRKVSPDGTVTTLAGTAGVSGSADGSGTAARFNGPSGIAVDSSGNVYVADTLNHAIRMITPSGMVSTIAGTAGASGATDATGSAARFYGPQGLALDSSGGLYVADTNNDTIRKIVLASDAVTTVAGLAGTAGSGDGLGADARFNGPSGLAVDGSGNLFIADMGNSKLREITANGAVVTVAGKTATPGAGDGSGDAAQFNHPTGVAVNAAGTVYVADTDNSTIRAVVVYVAPTISGQPQSQTVTAGTNVQFSVTASGQPAPTYQWSFNGSAISGATGATLSLSSVQTSDAGNYAVTVSNAGGSATSSTAVLTVNAPSGGSGSGGGSSGGGGGGGAMGAPFALGLALLAAARASRRRQRH